jgi:hypothetical protein
MSLSGNGVPELPEPPRDPESVPEDFSAWLYRRGEWERFRCRSHPVSGEVFLALDETARLRALLGYVPVATWQQGGWRAILYQLNPTLAGPCPHPYLVRLGLGGCEEAVVLPDFPSLLQLLREVVHPLGGQPWLPPMPERLEEN